METILLATDGSPSAAKATNTAIELAQAADWQLRVVTVWAVPLVGYGYAPAVYVPELSEIEREHAGEVARAAVETATADGVAATYEVREGNAVDEICAAAEESSAKLIVLGAHGWGAVKRLVFGSVSAGVLHDAECPVLVVRGEPGDAAEPAAAAGAEQATA
jgi:nucleotide-binding universal stress UspA family protein